MVKTVMMFDLAGHTQHLVGVQGFDSAITALENVNLLSIDLDQTPKEAQGKAEIIQVFYLQKALGVHPVLQTRQLRTVASLLYL